MHESKKVRFSTADASLLGAYLYLVSVSGANLNSKIFEAYRFVKIFSKTWQWVTRTRCN